MSIHHTIIKQAAKLNITLEVNNGKLVAMDDISGTRQVPVAATSENARNAIALIVGVRAKGKEAPAPKGPVVRVSDRKRAEAKAAREKLVKAGMTTADADDEDGEETATKSVINDDYKAKYAENGGTCGDDLALALKTATTGEGGLDLVELKKIAKANGLTYAWDHLNPGMQRMNVSNRLRGMIRKGEDVKIAGRTFKGDKQD